jgi:hypothetical protein
MSAIAREEKSVLGVAPHFAPDFCTEKPQRFQAAYFPAKF